MPALSIPDKPQRQKAFFGCGFKCPFVEENLKKQSLKEYTQYLSEFLNNATSPNILKNNPQIIQAYPEVLNLKELKL